MQRERWRIGMARVGSGLRRILIGLMAAAMPWVLPPLSPAAAAEREAGTAPGAELVLLVSADGRIEASGTAPPGLDAAAIRRLLPMLERPAAILPAAGLAADSASRWRHALRALSVVMPRIGTARIVLCDRRIGLNGQLREGFAIRETRPALRAALGPDWRLDFALSEKPPPAELSLTWQEGRLALAGILPAGISVRQAQLTLGLPVADPGPFGLGTGGKGDPAVWSRGLAALGTALALHERAKARIAATGVELSGRLMPGQPKQALGDWLSARLGPGWTVTLDIEEVPAQEGAVRRDPASGQRERLIGGHWILLHDFPVVPAACERMTGAAAAGEALTFQTGQSAPEPRTERLLDRLAGVARHCAMAGLTLLIGGHTDNLGADVANLALSQSRADAVREALRERGVPSGAMHAKGHGASMPVASNEDAAGRLRNRRISFDWTGG